MYGFLAFISFVAVIVGVICIVKPIERIGIKKRKHGLLLATWSLLPLVLSLIGMAPETKGGSTSAAAQAIAQIEVVADRVPKNEGLPSYGWFRISNKSEMVLASFEVACTFFWKDGSVAATEVLDYTKRERSFAAVIPPGGSASLSLGSHMFSAVRERARDLDAAKQSCAIHRATFARPRTFAGLSIAYSARKNSVGDIEVDVRLANSSDQAITFDAPVSCLLTSYTSSFTNWSWFKKWDERGYHKVLPDLRIQADRQLGSKITIAAGETVAGRVVHPDGRKVSESAGASSTGRGAAYEQAVACWVP